MPDSQSETSGAITFEQLQSAVARINLMAESQFPNPATDAQQERERRHNQVTYNYWTSSVVPNPVRPSFQREYERVAEHARQVHNQHVIETLFYGTGIQESLGQRENENNARYDHTLFPALVKCNCGTTACLSKYRGKNKDEEVPF